MFKWQPMLPDSAICSEIGFFLEPSALFFGIAVVSIDLNRAQIFHFHTMEYIGVHLVLSICDIIVNQKLYNGQ